MYLQTKDEITKVFNDMGIKENPNNKTITQDFRDKYYSLGNVRFINNIQGRFQEYIFPIEVGFIIKDSKENVSRDDIAVIFEELLSRISETNNFLNFEGDVVLSTMPDDNKKLIGTFNVRIMDAEQCL